MPAGQHRRRRPGFVITEARLLRTDVQTISDIPTTRINRTIVDLAAHLGGTRFEGALDAAVTCGLTSVSALSRYLEARRLGHNRGARLLTGFLSDRQAGVSESELERVFLAKLRVSHLPEPVRQHRCGKRKIDFAYPQGRIAIELDGLRHHFSAAAFHGDRRRQNELVLAGWTPYRFTWADVTTSWPLVERTLRLALRLADSS
jgi:very-short-patch-repair endonuclease